jgi:hypothetical protein
MTRLTPLPIEHILLPYIYTARMVNEAVLVRSEEISLEAYG